MNTYKSTARIVGVLFLIATAAYMYGNVLVQSILTAPDYLIQVYSDPNRLLTGVLIQFVGATANVCIGVMMFPILKKHSESIAVGYVATRIFDGAGLVIAGIGILSLITLSQQAVQAGVENFGFSLTLGNVLVAGSHTGYLITMMALGLGSLPFCYLLYRSRIIPRPMALLGFIGYVALVAGSGLELFGINLNMLHYIPGGIFELILPLWLFVKGFNATALLAQPDSASNRMSLSKA